MKRREFMKKVGIGTSTIKMMKDSTWTPKFWKEPEKYLNPEETEDILFLREWTEEKFTYETDPLGGAVDVVRDIDWIIKNKRGDCTDYTALALSWMIQHGYEDIYILFAFQFGQEGPLGHIVATNEYSAYDINDTFSIEHYQDKYWFTRRKKIDIEKVREINS